MPYSEAQKKATEKYKKNHYKRVPLDMKQEEYERLKAYCEKAGVSVNGYIRNLINENIKDA